jgi:SAM-dependent methyltransferase
MGTVQTNSTGYAFVNSGREARTRFAALSTIYDRGTIRHLEDLGISSGWHCLEIGGGSGTIAKWLADRVGSAGHVLATDLDTRFLEPLKGPNLEVCRHNIATDPLPEAAFDLIHTRLVLMHVIERDAALAQMISSLKPGGWLLMEEYDSCSMLPHPVAHPAETISATHLAMQRLLEDNGVNRRYGRLLAGLLRARGLSSVGAEAQSFLWQGGSAGTALMRANLEQLRETMIERSYITQREFDRDLAQLDDPDLLIPSSILWSVWGRRP